MVTSMCIIVFLSLGSCSFPAWPPSYTIKGTWSIPYANVTNPITIVQEPKRQYTNQLNGVEQIWNTGPEEKIHRKIVGNGYGQVCYGYNLSTPWTIEMTEFLPSPEGYSKQDGEYAYNGVLCDLYIKKEGTAKPQTWKLYINHITGYPVAYIAQAVSLFHSHYDVYVLEIHEFMPEALPGVWVLPNICKSASIQPDPYPGNQFNLFFPGKNSKQNFQENIKQLKERKVNHIPRYAHMDSKKWLETIKMNRRNLGDRQKHECTTFKATNDFDLPVNFSWRDRNLTIVGPPRDQVACGSCWAFGTAEVMESQFAMQTGVYKDISVSQIMDCTWDYNNFGCQGGEVAPALTSLMKNNVQIAYEEDYPYLGVSGQCQKEDLPKYAGKVKGCFVVEKTTRAVKEALYKSGPLAIAINVVEEMSFYTGGVVDNQQCTGAEDDLVHAVLLTGWKVIDGKEAWEIKNSWSTYWGYEGYVYVQSENQEWNCGVTTDAVGVIVENYKQN